MNKTELQTLVVRVKKYLLIIFLLCLAGVFIYAYLQKPEFPSEVVLKQDFIPGQSIYIVQDARDPDEPKNLRFYVNNGDGRNNETMKVLLGKTPAFLVSDTDLKDVVIQRVSNGLHIKLKGAVSNYQSNLYLEDGDTYTTYRVSLEQVETRPPLPSGR
ncbi:MULTISPECIES: hypothetical protein [Pseudomonas]|jgi:hypothetical protein|uniref:hypothetical protein n=1 Tax=Pseudomonas TaxID=286 RepID=UPI00062B1BA8|nr:MULTISPECIES: hypothetical protein [Pseudomonas]KKX57632.1 hypothetical protein PU99_28600 [Pseudomonas putida]MCK8658462.1 hypothetical protein [Pseudomonas umsongensis]NBB62931.1 hypothetical protein [Pseudomonas sp. ODNR1LW]OMQ41409.1 hypothetical protein BKX96_06420 [Pseudomonas putida]